MRALSGPESSVTSANRAVAFIFVAVLLNSVGFGIVMPVLPELIVDVTGDPLHEAARHGGWLVFVYALMQFFCAPLAGNLSDRFGRRPVLLGSLFVFGLDYLIMGFAPTLAWLYAGRLVAGMSATSFAIANACVADLFPPEKRAQNFGLMGAAFGVGFILGPVIGGFLGEFGPRTPFFATAGIAFATAAFGWLAIPETLPREHRRPFRASRANPLGAFRQMRRFPVVIGILAAYFLYMTAQNSLPVTWAFFSIERYGWGPREIGFSLGFVGACMLIVQGFVIRRAIPAWGAERCASWGLALAAVSLLGYALLSPVGWMLYVWIVVGAGVGTRDAGPHRRHVETRGGRRPGGTAGRDRQRGECHLGGEPPRDDAALRLVHVAGGARLLPRRGLRARGGAGVREPCRGGQDAGATRYGRLIPGGYTAPPAGGGGGSALQT